MFPRGHYIDHAEDVLSKGFFKDSLLYLDKQLAINPLDSRTYFLKGVYYANMENPARDIQLAQQNFRLALDLNPLGDFGYYRDYFRTLVELKQTDEIQRFIDEVSPLLNTYFGYVENNVHFTAYTDNVESAANLIDLMLPYASGQVAADLLVRKSIMLDTAEDLRAQKKF
jgi:tetratricopeptide (TPR) repeat protein